MNKEITIYELLGLMKDDMCKSICIKYLDEDKPQVEVKETGFSLLRDLLNEYLTLDEKVEILEEDKDIELLDVALLSQSDNWLWCPSKDDFEKDIELNSYIISNIRENTLNFQRKLNEVIKEVNKLRKENNNG